MSSLYKQYFSDGTNFTLDPEYYTNIDKWFVIHIDLNIGVRKTGYRKATLLYNCAKSAKRLQSKCNKIRKRERKRKREEGKRERDWNKMKGRKRK